MTLKEFFNSPQVSLPRGGFDGKETFQTFMKRLFDNYTVQLNLIDDPDIDLSARKKLVKVSSALSESVLESVRRSLQGRVHMAYQEISVELSKIDWKPFRSRLEVREPNSVNPNDPFLEDYRPIHRPALYRVRSDRSDFNYLKRPDIFHVPFEKRRLVGNQRYSIAGLPCLYLGSSLWICWEELGRPALDSLWVSRFQIAQPVSVLDFQFSPHQVWAVYEKLKNGNPKSSDNSCRDKLKNHFNLDFLKSYACYWPLIAACSIRRDQREGPFAPEFIVPQLLLQWVAQRHDLDGIRYFSAWTPPEGNHLHGYSNCVFPVKTLRSKGHCMKLTKKFALTEPIPWEALTAVNIGNRSSITAEDSNASASIKLNNDLCLEYTQTDFFFVEMKLGEIEKRENCSRTMDAKPTAANPFTAPSG
jgi:hypothetical protein